MMHGPINIRSAKDQTKETLKQKRKEKKRNELKNGRKWNQRAKEEEGNIDMDYSGEGWNEK